MFWIKTIKEIKREIEYSGIEISSINRRLYNQIIKIQNIQFDITVEKKLLENKLKEIEKIQKGAKKKK